jgi:Ca-activated chloride channel family protein
MFLWLLIPLFILLWRTSFSFVHKTHLVILVLITLSLTRPVIEEIPIESNIEGRDIIIALDISYSMNANDIKPNRYEFAKETIYHLLKNNPTDNVMIIAFTTNPLLLSPPTTDHELIKIALESLNREFILTKGTSLKKLFKKLASMKIGHQNLILMTDGGEESDSEELREILKESEISLTILALGTLQGTTVSSEDSELLKDEDGNLVISRLNPMLKSLSSSYFEPSTTPQATAQDIYSSFSDETKRAKKMQYSYMEFYQIPLIVAILLFLMLHTRAVKYLLFISMLFTSSNASALDEYYLQEAYKSYKVEDYNTTKSCLKKIVETSLESKIALANTDYKQGKYKKAIESYKSISSTSTEIKQQLYYNIANSYVKLSKYKKAKIYYTKVLQLGEDDDAKYNLQLIVFLSDKKDDVGIAHPKSQNSSSSKSQNKNDKETKRDEDKPSSGGSGDGKSSKEKEQDKQRLKSNNKVEKQPLSSKVYELINEGYIYEKQPW